MQSNNQLTPEEWKALTDLYNGWWVSTDMIPVLIEKNLAWYQPLDKMTQLLQISTKGLRLIEQKEKS